MSNYDKYGKTATPSTLPPFPAFSRVCHWRAAVITICRNLTNEPQIGGPLLIGQIVMFVWARRCRPVVTVRHILRLGKPHVLLPKHRTIPKILGKYRITRNIYRFPDSFSPFLVQFGAFWDVLSRESNILKELNQNCLIFFILPRFELEI